MGAAGTIGRQSVVQLREFQVGRVDNSGYVWGSASNPNSVANGTTTHMYRVRNPVSISADADTVPVVRFQGGGVEYASTFVGITERGNFTIEFSSFDEQFEAFLNRTLIDVTTNTGATVTVDNARQTTFDNIALLMAMAMTNPDTGVDEFVNIAMTGKLVRTEQQGAEQVTGDTTNPSNISYRFTRNVVNRHIFGVPISAGVNGVAASTVVRIRTAKPLALTSYKGDDTDTTFALGFLPTSNSVTGALDGQFISRNGVITPVTTVNTTTGVVTPAAIADGDNFVVLYPTDFNPIPD